MALWRRGDQDQLNIPATTEMVGNAGKVVVIDGKALITLEDVTESMAEIGKGIGAATAGIWTFPKNTGVAVAQLAPVFVNVTTQQVDATGQFVGYAERTATADDEAIYVIFLPFVKPVTT